MTFSTPMMKQYWEIKKKYQDCLVFFRMGDFYELFLEDAHIGSSILNITLTKKSGGKDGKIPMAGVPYHAVDSYISKLVKSGYKVAICEQLSPPSKRGLVKRDVVRIITPGTILDERSLEKKKNNNIVSIYMEGESLGLSVSDISTGYFATDQFDGDFPKIISDVFSSLSPTECILPDEIYNDSNVLEILSYYEGLNIYPYSQFESVARNASEFLRKHFHIKTLETFGLQDKPLAIKSAAGLLSYVKDTQKAPLTHIQKISLLTRGEGVVLDRSTIINLELLSTIREHDTKASLLNTIDHTITPMGGRLLRTWLLKPLSRKEEIDTRLDSVEMFTTDPQLRDAIREKLKRISDTERLISRLSVGLGNARDIINLSNTFDTMLSIRSDISHIDTALIRNQKKEISLDLSKLTTYINHVFVDEPPISIRDGGMIRDGVNEELDLLKKHISKSKSWIIELEKKERERTGISSLKVRFNKVFGFYIEVSKSNLSHVPTTYIRKQTLVNAERFITHELKEHEEIVLSAEEKIKDKEYEIYQQSLIHILRSTRDIQLASQSIGVIDCLSAFSHLAEKHRYVKPTILFSGEVRIKDGRHPVVERFLEHDQFVPNNTTIDQINQSLLLITGPNMAGKSVYIRQVAIIVLMAHIGCFVPASSAHISLTDKIFVRSGASDVITSGLSTFMVEMVETAHILNTATEKSLIVMDEIGRGTSTYDGISIAWAVVEYLARHFESSPKTLFATHYHELQRLEDEFPNKVKNFHMAVTEERGDPVFLHSLLPGGASHSFGVSVAKLAGIPEEVTKRAREILSTLEMRSVDVRNSTSLNPGAIQGHDALQKIFFTQEDEQIAESLIQTELENVDIGNITPLEALNKLSEIKEKIKLLRNGKRTYLEAD